MTPVVSDAAKIKQLPWYLGYGAFAGIFMPLTVFGSIFTLFLNELGLDKARIGFLLSLTPLCGLISMLVAPIGAKFGYKRTFLTFSWIRNVIIALLLLTPLVLRVGSNAAFLWVAVIVVSMAFCRAIAETAFNPWVKELIPDFLRGKVNALSTLSVSLASILAVAAASLLMNHSSGVGRYIIVFSVGITAGILSIVCVTFLSGGVAVERANNTKAFHFREAFRPLRDRKFILFLVGLASFCLGLSFTGSFSPLFLKEQVGIPVDKLILSEIACNIGILLTTYLWGWASDRYGSKPIMITSLWIILVVPISMLLMPRHSYWSFPLAILNAFISGLSIAGWVSGWSRYFYNTAVPAGEQNEYCAVYYTWISIFSGLAPIMAGNITHYSSKLSGTIGCVVIDSYSPIFFLAFVIYLLGLTCVYRLTADTPITTLSFIRMFTRGNALKGIWALIRYRFTRNENDRIKTTRHMGSSNTPLVTREVLNALHDPSINVRCEAINAIVNMRNSPDAVKALIDLLENSDPETCVSAVWALGRIKDISAISPLRKILFAHDNLVRAGSARVLAVLGDTQSIPLLLNMLQSEEDETVRFAVACALGQLHAVEAIDSIVHLLKDEKRELQRGELALALARFAGDESTFIKLWRSQSAFATSAVLTIAKVKKQLARTNIYSGKLFPLIEEVETKFSQGCISEAAVTLSDLVRTILPRNLPQEYSSILRTCADALFEHKDTRREYIILSLHMLMAESVQKRLSSAYDEKRDDVSTAKCVDT